MAHAGAAGVAQSVMTLGAQGGRMGSEDAVAVTTQLDPGQDWPTKDDEGLARRRSHACIQVLRPSTENGRLKLLLVAVESTERLVATRDVGPFSVQKSG